MLTQQELDANQKENRETLTRIHKKNWEYPLVEKFGNRYLSYRKDWKSTSTRDKIMPFPLHIDFESIDKCNLACNFCLHNKATREKSQILKKIPIGSQKVMDYTLFEKIINEGKKYNLPSINLGLGAEAFLDPLLFERTKYAFSNGVMDIRIHTNGTLISDDNIDKILESNISILMISLDAFKSETYKKIRGANLKKTTKNILKLLTEKKKRNMTLPIVRVSFLSLPENKLEKKDFINFWKDKVDLIDFQDLIDYTSINNHKFDCFMPWRSVSIWHQGNVSLCCTYFGKLLNCGNCTTETIKEIWISKKSMNLRRTILEKSFNNICKYCALGREGGTIN